MERSLSVVTRLLGLLALCLFCPSGCSPTDVPFVCPTGTRMDGIGPPWGRRQTCILSSKQSNDGRPIRHGPSATWFSNGQMRSLSQYNHGQLNGEVRLWFANGKMSRLGRYANGFKVGEWTEWGVGGGMQCSTNYADGLMHGVRIFYYPNGRPKSEHMYVEGNLNGPSTSFYADGSVAEVGRYTNNIKTGRWIQYAAGGQVAKERTFPTPETTPKTLPSREKQRR